MPIVIDVSQVPTGLQNDPSFLKIRDGMQRDLSNTWYRDAVCIHEAGHYCYFVHAGVIAFNFNGPYIVHNSETGGFDGYSASVSAASWKPETAAKTTIERVIDMSFVSVAGGIASRIFANAVNVGDEADYINFKGICDKVGLSGRFDSMW